MPVNVHYDDINLDKVPDTCPSCGFGVNLHLENCIKFVDYIIISSVCPLDDCKAPILLNYDLYTNYYEEIDDTIIESTFKGAFLPNGKLVTKKLNFSQRNRFEEVEILQIDSMNKNLRTALYNFVYRKYGDSYNSAGYYSDSYYFHIKRDLIYTNFFKNPLRGIPNHNDGERKFYNWFFSCDWYKIYDFFEFCFFNIPKSHEDYNNYIESFIYELNLCLERENSGYRCNKDGLIVPITDKYELEEVENALNSDERYTNHSSKAAEYLRCRNEKKSDYRNSIKESISAVEAVVRKETDESTLGKGIERLENKGIKINKCLKEAFLKLYAYTNSEDGIRHAMMSDNDVSLAEAKFMLVACSAFINYLKLVA